jgi:uncharacterized protein YhaN
MDLMTDEDARDAETLASQFEAHADGETAKLIRSYATPGRGSKTEWQKFRLQVMPKLLTSAASNQTRLAITAEITARAKEIQRLRGETQKLLAIPKLDQASYKRMESHHRALKAQHDGYNNAHKRLEASVWLGMPPEAEAKITRQMRDVELKMQELQQEMNIIGTRLGGYDPSPASDAGTPANSDPLGIRR